MKIPASMIAVGAALALIATAAGTAATTTFITGPEDPGVQSSAKQTISIKKAAHPLLAVKSSTKKSSRTKSSATESATMVMPPRVKDIELPATPPTPNNVTSTGH